VKDIKTKSSSLQTNKISAVFVPVVTTYLYEAPISSPICVPEKVSENKK